VLPIGRNPGGRLIVAVPSPLGDKALEELRRAVGDEPLQRIARESEINDGLRLLRGVTGNADGQKSPPLLGDLLLEKGLMRREAFEAAMENYRPDEDGRIGEYLVRCGVVTEEALRATIREQERRVAASLAPV
jgi:bacteriophage N4 adsorption protein B